MVGGRLSPGVLGTCAALLAFVQAGPLLRLEREAEDYQNDFTNYTANEVCFSDQRVFQRGEEVPNAGPCEECRCEPPSIVCHMTKCPVNNNGCRTIQRPNHCCPDYNCECDYNGQLYNDGERIDLPEDPCQVCYCKGGDVMCTSVTCYQRDDCEPRRVPGQCCPKYEDCPIRDIEAASTDDKSVHVRSPNKTLNHVPKREMQPWLLTKSVPQTSSLPAPKVDEVTTETGNIVVSDWLMERRVSGDANSNQTDLPVTTTLTVTVTQLKESVQNIQNNSSETKAEVVMPTPIDEVVFTRVNIPIQSFVEKADLPTTIEPSTVESASLSLKGLNKPEKFKEVQTTTESVPLALNTFDSVQSLQTQNKTRADIDHSENNTLVTLNKEIEYETTTIFFLNNLTEQSFINLLPSDVHTEKTPIKIVSVQDKSFSAGMPDIFSSSTEEVSTGGDIKLINNNDSFTSQNVPNHNYSKEKFINTENITTSTGTSNNTKLSEEIESLFSFDISNSSTSNLTTSNKTFYQKDLDLTQIIKDNSTTLNQTLPESKTIITNNNTTSFKNSKIENFMENKDIFTNKSTTDEEITPEQIQITTPVTDQYEGADTTTFFNTADQKIESVTETEKLIKENRNIDGEDTTYSPEMTTTEFEKGVQSYVSENSTNNENFSVISILTDPLNFSSSHQDKFERVNLQNEATSYGIVEVTQPPDVSLNGEEDITLEIKETTENNLSEIEIIIKESNSTNGLPKKSVILNQKTYQEGLLLSIGLDEGSSEKKDVISNLPPVLELNSNVPFLQIGYDGSSDVSPEETLIHQASTKPAELENLVKSKEKDKYKVDEISTTNNENESSFTTVYPTVDNSETKSSKLNNKTGIRFNEKGEVSSVSTVAVIPLTPDDLKMIAEHLINETIKPVVIPSSSTYAPNQWLKGNLSSEGKISTILSATNVTIGIMNQTDARRKLVSTNTRDANKLDKMVKENRYNSLSESKVSILNKTGNLHNKLNGNQSSAKNISILYDSVKYIKQTTKNLMVEEPTTLYPTTTKSEDFVSFPTTFNSELLQRQSGTENTAGILNISHSHQHEKNAINKEQLEGFSVHLTVNGTDKIKNDLLKEETNLSQSINESKVFSNKDINVNLNESKFAGTKENMTTLTKGKFKLKHSIPEDHVITVSTFNESNVTIPRNSSVIPDQSQIRST